MDQLLLGVAGVLVGAGASGVAGVVARRAAEIRSQRLWRRHGPISAIQARLLTYLRDLGQATAADIAVATRLPPDRVAELLPGLIDAGWATVTDESGPLLLVGITAHGERTAAMALDAALHSDRPVGRSATGAETTERSAYASEQEVRALSAELDQAVADIQ